MGMSLDELVAASKPTTASLQAVATAKSGGPYVLQANQTSQPVNFSQINNTGPVFTTQPKNQGFTLGAGQKQVAGIGDIIKAAAEGGANQSLQGVYQAGEGLNTGNPIKMGEGTLNALAGAINAVSAPLAPVFEPLSMATNYLGSKLGEHYSDNPIIDNETATRIVQAISNAATIYGTFAGGTKAVEPTEEIPLGVKKSTIFTGNETPIIPPEPKAGVPVPKPEVTPIVGSEIKPPLPKEVPTTEAKAPVKTVGRTTQTLKPIEGTGALKTRGLSEGVEATAIEKKLADNFGDLPEYRQVSMKDQAQKAAELINKDPEAARAIAMGEKAPPKGLLPESVYVAAEQKAIAEGDAQMLKDLANSKLSASATTMGQRIRTLGERDSASPLAAIQEVQKARAEAQAARGVTPEKVINTIKQAIRKTNTKETWSSFVESITC